MIPTHVSHADYVAAMKPLLDLLGVSANEIYQDFHITAAPNDSASLATISFAVVATFDGDSEYPPAVRVEGAEGSAAEYAEFSYRVSVEVI